MPQAVRRYFRNIRESVSTVAQGMWITYKTAFGQRKITIQYPSYDILEGRPRDQGPKPAPPFWEALLGASQSYRGPLRTRVAEGYRGFLGFEDSTCIGCLACSRACPIGVITMEALKIPGRKAKAPTMYSVDFAKCMFCGLCVEACPTAALFFTREFEAATFDFRELARDFVSPAVRNERLELARQAAGKSSQGETTEGDGRETEES